MPHYSPTVTVFAERLRKPLFFIILLATISLLGLFSTPVLGRSLIVTLNGAIFPPFEFTSNFRLIHLEHRALSKELFISPMPQIRHEADTRSATVSLLTADSNTPVSIFVSSAEALQQALSSAVGGETIRLAPGEYGNLDLRNHAFDSVVTIDSADPDNPASFGRVYLNNVENLSFSSIKFDYVAAEGSPNHLRAVDIYNSKNISITNSIFDGDLARGVSEIDDGYPTGLALGLTRSENIRVEGNEFYDWFKAISSINIDNLVVKNNNAYALAGDGFTFVGVNQVLIEGNHLHDFNSPVGSGFHRDMIQFWTTGATRPSTDITITGNILDSGGGAWTQSIFMRNELVDTGKAGDEMFYRNVTITDNVIYNGHVHGITVGETHGLVIQNNTLLLNEGAPEYPYFAAPGINVKNTSTDVYVGYNILTDLKFDSTDNRIVENNFLVQRNSPGAEHYYADLFVGGLPDYTATISQLAPIPGGTIEQLGVGSSLFRFDPQPGATTGFIDVVNSEGLMLLQKRFDAGNLFGPEGQIDAKGVQVVWDFGDGNSAKGLALTHSYAKAGVYTVTAQVTLAGGEFVELRKNIAVETPVALYANFDQGAGDLSDLSNPVTVGDAVSFETGKEGGQAIRLNGGLVTYARGPEFFNNQQYTIALDFKKDVGAEGSKGQILTFNGNFSVFVDSAGLRFIGNTDSERILLNVQKLSINDADWHQLAVTFSGETGEAILYLDGAEVGRVMGLEGARQGNTQADLHLGNPWGASFPGLIDNVMFLKGAMTAEQVSSYHLSPETFLEELLTPKNLYEELPSLEEPSMEEPSMEGPSMEEPPVDRTGNGFNEYPALLYANFDQGAEDLSAVRNDVTFADSVTFEQGKDGGQAIRLNGGLVTYTRGPEFFNNKEYTFLFDFKKDEGAENSKGQVITLIGSFSALVDANGLNVNAVTAEGHNWIKAQKLGLNDSDWHQLAFTFSGEEGTAILYLDGVEVGRIIGLEESSQGNTQANLHIGNPHGASFPGLIDNVMFLKGAMTAEEIKSNFENPWSFFEEPVYLAEISDVNEDDGAADAFNADQMAGADQSMALADPVDTEPVSFTSNESNLFDLGTNEVETAAIVDDGDSATGPKGNGKGVPGGGNGGGNGLAKGKKTDPSTTTTLSENLIYSSQDNYDSNAFVFSSADLSAADGELETDLLAWSPADAESDPIEQDFGLAEELMESQDVQQPDLLLA